jgi:hypothetical protein
MFSVGLDALFFNVNSFFIPSLHDVSLIDFTLFKQAASLILQKPVTTLRHNNTNEEIKQIIFGSLSGEAKLELAPRGLNARFGFIQSIKFKDYIIILCFLFT